MNCWNGIGRLGADPEKKVTSGGTKVAQFSIAVDAYKKNDPPMWLTCVCYVKTAEIAGLYATKGREVGISGLLNIRVFNPFANLVRYNICFFRNYIKRIVRCSKFYK